MQNQSNRTKGSNTEQFYARAIAGGLAGSISNIATQPFDVIKTLVIGRASTNASSTAQQHGVNIFSTATSLVNEHGLRGLFRGSVPTFFRVFPGATIYYGLFYPLENQFKKARNTQQLNTVEMFLIGAISRTAAVMAVNPMSVVKTRFEFAQKELIGEGGSVLRTLAHIYSNEGFRGFYAGMVPTLIRDVPYAGLSYTAYNHSKNFLTQVIGMQNDSARVSLVAGSLSGLFATLVTYPFDLVRTRMQLRSEYKGMLDAFTQIVKSSNNQVSFTGIKGLYRGMTLRIFKKAATGALSWTAFEQVTMLLLDKLAHVGQNQVAIKS